MATRSARLPVLRVARVILALTLAGIAVCGAYSGMIIVRHDRAVELPTPSGRFGVGRIITELTDQHRPDPVAPHPGQPRRLSAWIWYPAGGPSAEPAEYAPGAWSRTHLPPPITLGQTRFERVRTHSSDHAAPADGAFPVVVLEPGLGLAVLQYTTLAEDLASHGYIVVGVTPTYSAAVTVLDGAVVRSDGAPAATIPDDGDLHSARTQTAGDRLVRVWADDALFAARTVENRQLPDHLLDGHAEADRTGYVGHSFGGAASLQACSDDGGCTGAVDLDGTQFGAVARSGLGKPSLTVSSDSCVAAICPVGDAPDASDRAVADGFFAHSAQPAWRVRIAGARHFDFTDYAAYYLAAPLSRFIALGSIDGRRALAITSAYVDGFFDATAGRSPSTDWAAALAIEYPETR